MTVWRQQIHLTVVYGDDLLQATHLIDVTADAGETDDGNDVAGLVMTGGSGADTFDVSALAAGVANGRETSLK